jgi:hypothetical protein
VLRVERLGWIAYCVGGGGLRFFPQTDTARHSPLAILDLSSPLLPYSFLIPRPLPLAGRSLAALFLNPTRKGTWGSQGGGRPVCTTWYLLVE